MINGFIDPALVPRSDVFFLCDLGKTTCCLILNDHRTRGCYGLEETSKPT